MKTEGDGKAGKVAKLKKGEILMAAWLGPSFHGPFAQVLGAELRFYPCHTINAACSSHVISKSPRKSQSQIF